MADQPKKYETICDLHQLPLKYIKTTTFKLMCGMCREDDFENGRMESNLIEDEKRAQIMLRSDLITLVNEIFEELSQSEGKIKDFFKFLEQKQQPIGQKERFVIDLSKVLQQDQIPEITEEFLQSLSNLVEITRNKLNKLKQKLSLDLLFIQEHHILESRDKYGRYVTYYKKYKVRKAETDKIRRYLEEMRATAELSSQQVQKKLEGLSRLSLVADTNAWQEELEVMKRMFAGDELKLQRINEIFEMQNVLINKVRAAERQYERQFSDQEADFEYINLKVNQYKTKTRPPAMSNLSFQSDYLQHSTYQTEDQTSSDRRRPPQQQQDKNYQWMLSQSDEQSQTNIYDQSSHIGRHEDHTMDNTLRNFVKELQ